METGLLARLQSYFSTSFGGRYVEYVVKEMIAEQPRLATLLFGAKRSDTVQAEYRFEIGNRTRIADLVFLDPETELPTHVVEIKYDDHKSPSNAAQLTDYFRLCRKHDCELTFLTQHMPGHELRRRLTGSARLVLFSDLAEKLKNGDGAVRGLLRQFFVDRGLVMHKFERRDVANLTSFLFRLVNPWMGQGRSQSKDAMSGGVADAFGNLLKNMNIIAKEVVANIPGRSPTIDFELEPWVKPKRVQKEASKNPGAESVSAYDAKAGGQLSAFGRIRLDDTTSNWLQLEFGLGMETDLGDKNIYPFTFATVHSCVFKDHSSYKYKYAPIRILHDKQRAVAAIRMRINEVIQHAIRRGPPKSQIAKLKRFQKTLR